MTTPSTRTTIRNGNGCAIRTTAAAASATVDRAVRTRDPRFEERAVCGPKSARLFDPKTLQEPIEDYERRRRAAKAVCSGCPVLQACGEWGIRNDCSGVFGGLELHRGRVVEVKVRKR